MQVVDYFIHCPTVGKPRTYDLNHVAHCASSESGCIVATGGFSCQRKSPFEGQVVQVAIPPTFTYLLPGSLFGKEETGGYMVRVMRALAVGQKFSLKIKVEASGSFSRKTRSFSAGGYKGVKCLLKRCHI